MAEVRVLKRHLVDKSGLQMLHKSAVRYIWARPPEVPQVNEDALHSDGDLRVNVNRK